MLKIIHHELGIKCRFYNLKVTASFKNKNAIEFYQKNVFLEFDLTLTTNIDKEDKSDF